MSHPILGSAERQSAAETAVANFVAELQSGLDGHDSDVYNRSFADDVVWGGPFGATVTGYEALHAIHQRLQTVETEMPSRYEVVQVMSPADGVAVAHVRRRSLDSDAMSEMALYVLIRRDGRWWLSAGQNTVIKPGQSATD